MTFNPTDFSDILRSEQLKLDYDKEIFGRPKKADRPLESFPDYILVVDKTWRWVIEAKSPSEKIGKKEVWQAYSYAKHHEVRAVMYCVCNGRELKIFRTDFAPAAALVKEFAYEEFDAEVDGTFTYQNMSSSHPLMRNMDVSFLRDLNFTIVGGFIERTNHKMHAVVITRSPSVEGQRISESIGIDKIELWSDAIQISDTASEPTIFSYIANYTIPPARTRMFGMPIYGNSIPCTVKTTLRIHLAGSIVEGDFDASLTILVVNQTIPVTMRGALVANLQ